MMSKVTTLAALTCARYPGIGFVMPVWHREEAGGGGDDVILHHSFLI